MPTQLNVTVLYVAYPAPTAAGDWFILVTDAGKCKGKMPWRPAAQESLTLTGEWVAYQGQREFAFASARLNIPVHPRDQLHYVCARTPGLGPAAESQLWETLGEAWQTAQPGTVPRLRGRTFEEFRVQVEAMAAKGEEMRAVATLVGKGCTENMAARAWATWGAATLGIVHADPFRLADLDGYSFRDVDGGVRRAYGIEDADARRIRAGTLYALRQLTDAGDTLITWDALHDQAVDLLRGYSDEIAACTEALFADGFVRPFEACGSVALAADFEAERSVWEWVRGAKVSAESSGNSEN